MHVVVLHPFSTKVSRLALQISAARPGSSAAVMLSAFSTHCISLVATYLLVAVSVRLSRCSIAQDCLLAAGAANFAMLDSRLQSEHCSAGLHQSTVPVPKQDTQLFRRLHLFLTWLLRLHDGLNVPQTRVHHDQHTTCTVVVLVEMVKVWPNDACISAFFPGGGGGRY
jgi:hypothetical protein